MCPLNRGFTVIVKWKVSTVAPPSWVGSYEVPNFKEVVFLVEEHVTRAYKMLLWLYSEIQ